MTYSACKQADFNKIKAGQLFKINGRYEDLKRENGKDFEYVARKDDVVVARRKSGSAYVVSFYVDIVRLQTNRAEKYGEFLVHPKHIQTFD